MNVSAAKIPFTYETLTHMLCPFGEFLQCQDDMKLNETFDESKDNTQINLKRLGIIKDTLLKTTNEVFLLVKSGISTLNYCVHIGSTFIQYFMNKTKKITKDNIEEIELLIKLFVLFCLLEKEDSRNIRNIRMGGNSQIH